MPFLLLFIAIGHAARLKPPKQRCGDEEGRRDGEIWNAAGHFARFDHRWRRECQLHWAISQPAQGATDEFAKAVYAWRHVFGQYSIGDDDIFERIEKLNTRLEFLDEKFRDVAQRRAAAAEEHPLRRRATLGGTVEIHRPRNLGVEAGHRIADDF